MSTWGTRRAEGTKGNLEGGGYRVNQRQGSSVSSAKWDKAGP